MLEQQISVLSAQIVNTQALIEEYDVQIADKQVELENAQQKADEYYQLFPCPLPGSGGAGAA